MIRAKYTVVLHTLMNDQTVKEQLDQALSTYPLYKPEKVYDLIPTREQLNDRLLNHYKYREIGFETVGRFLDELKIAMGEIMPRYNELFKTVETMANLPNPFDNVDVVETFEEQKTNASTSETSSTASDSATTSGTASSYNKHVNSKTPQDGISIPAEGIDSVNYADEAQWNKDSSTSAGSSSSNGETSANASNEGTETTTHTYTKKGNQGVNTYAHDMLEFRTQIIDVVDQIVNDRRIRELFMLVY